ncbi:MULTISPECIES: winged helix-turn-helix domain-containing protein [unclassified Sinorhizobium]|uniref:winged helix-turn-helix domain-containing protein n=1 Tax=unclassified Sinorhizobium TaxID=2613772 RepID=UPI0024C3AE31|nr:MULTISPECIES: winged helix-turn-helix domain-containing protein [unclassified Sinorhizobium]MDK1375725.1 winged helix-turn-helix domain-containing protein [Sinorhizobium sp. 6-70]MDK1482348.1 winged helix-turn-helix domain-containing protein [Sinorhizobium sp. 6-117]
MTIRLSNRDARRIFLAKQGLSAAPQRALGKEGLLKLIRDLGFVQVDSIATVERAHHQILFSRNQTYRREHLTELLEKDGELFEHWTHDASIIPSAFFIYWKHRFKWESETLRERWLKWRGEGFDDGCEETYERIVSDGAVMARDLKMDGHVSGGWWNWHPSKTALEVLWRQGRLAIARRENFQKVYDLTERVIPPQHYEGEVGHAEFIDWACRSALDRLGFATHGEIAAFWDLVSPDEAKAWVAAHRDELSEVLIESANGGKPRASYALSGFPDNLGDIAEPPGRIRVLSPFDPLLRDRNRTERLFGFFYRIEVFVPEAKREYGYYVFPLIEGDRLIGRIDMKADRKLGRLDVRRLWLEPGVRVSSGRMEKLAAELDRIARFTGVEDVNLLDGWNAPVS